MDEINFYHRHRFLQGLENLNFKGNYRLVNLLSRLLLPKPHGELILRTIYGFPLLINPKLDEGVEEGLYYTGSYEKGTLHFMQQFLKPGDVFVDAGANIGLMTVFAAKLLGDLGNVLAFEPNPETKKILDFNIALNHLNNVAAFGLGLGTESKTAPLYTNWHINRGAASLLKPEIQSDHFEVKIERLDDYFPEQMPVHLIKIDVEGYEPAVLQGALGILTRKNAPALIIENNDIQHQGMDGKKNLRSWLKGINAYRFFMLRKGKGRISSLIELQETTPIPPFNNIFCLLEEHIESLPAQFFNA